MHRLLADIREMLHEQREYRELLLQMTRRDLLLRYKQTAMGFGWAVFMPIVNTAVFSVVFMRVAPIETPVPYPVFAFCGLWIWNFHASALGFSANSLTSNATLVAKVYFPREMFPFSAIIVSLVDFAIGAVPLIGLMVYYQVPVSVHLFWLPLVVLVQLCFTAALALTLAMGNLYYRDVKYVLGILMSAWMFATPVVYSLDQLGGRTETLMRLNPMTPIVEAYRAVILQQSPPADAFVVMAAISVALLVWAWVLFHRLEFQFAENV